MRSGEFDQLETEGGVNRRVVLGCDEFERSDDVLGKPDGAKGQKRRQNVRYVFPERVLYLRKGPSRSTTGRSSSSPGPIKQVSGLFLDISCLICRGLHEPTWRACE